MKTKTLTFEQECDNFIIMAKDLEDFCSEEEIIETLWEDCLTCLPKGKYKKLVMKKLLEKYKNQPEAKSFVLYQSEIDFLNNLPSQRIKELFYLLLGWKKMHPHGESEWIRFDFDKIFLTYFMKGEIKQADLGELFNYGFEMQVRGSKAAVACFKIPIIEETGETYEIKENELKEKFGEIFNVTD